MAHLLLNSGLPLDLNQLEAAVQARRASNLYLLQQHQQQQQAHPSAAAAAVLGVNPALLGAGGISQQLALLQHQQHTQPPLNAAVLAAASAPHLERNSMTAAATDAQMAAATLQQLSNKQHESNTSIENPSVVASEAHPAPKTKTSSASPSSSTSSGDEGDDEEVNSPQQRVPHKRNPNDLDTAAPVTCLEDFINTPITTTLNNLKGYPAAKKPASSSAATTNTNTAAHNSALFQNHKPVLTKSLPANFVPRDQDVVIDMAHYPNRAFHKLLERYLPSYLSMGQSQRQTLVAALLHYVFENGGIFVQHNSSTGSWVPVDKAQAERFTAQALKEAARAKESAPSAKASPKRRNSRISPRPSFSAKPSPRPSFSAISELPISEKRASLTIELPNFTKQSSFNSTSEVSASSKEEARPSTDKALSDRPRKRASFRASFSEGRPSKRPSFRASFSVAERPVKRPSFAMTEERAVKRPSFALMEELVVKRPEERAVKRASFNIPRPTQEIPMSFRKRPSQAAASIEAAAAEAAASEGRSALSIKFKRPRSTSLVPTRKVSMEPSKNPLAFLSEIAALDDSSSGEEEEVPITQDNKSE